MLRNMTVMSEMNVDFVELHSRFQGLGCRRSVSPLRERTVTQIKHLDVVHGSMPTKRNRSMLDKASLKSTAKGRDDLHKGCGSVWTKAADLSGQRRYCAVAGCCSYEQVWRQTGAKG